MKFKAILDDKSMEITLDERARIAEVDGMEHRYQPVHSAGLHHMIRVNDRLHEVIPITIDGAEPGEHAMLVNGHHVRLRVLDAQAAEEQALAATVGHVHKAAVVKAPMPGRIIAIHASVGDAVKKGDGIVTLEAMKLENEIKCPTNGTLKALHVTVSDAVEKNALIAEIE